MNLGLTGKHALVLGASQGLGQAVARALLDEGARVSATARSAGKLEAFRASLPSEQQQRCFIVPADLAAPDFAKSVCEASRRAGGAIDILVNNTGGPPPGPPSAILPDDMRAQFNKMVLPVVELTLLVVREMRTRQFGRVLTIASSGVVQPIPFLPLSNTLRSSLVGFMKSLATEVARDGVTVNVLLPGRIATDRTIAIDTAQAHASDRSVQAVEQESADTIPMGRYGTVEEFGAVAAFLAGVPASYVTGSLIRVDGGAIRSI